MLKATVLGEDARFRPAMQFGETGMSERLSYWEMTSKGGPPSKTADEFWKEYDAKKK